MTVILGYTSANIQVTASASVFCVPPFVRMSNACLLTSVHRNTELPYVLSSGNRQPALLLLKFVL